MARWAFLSATSAWSIASFCDSSARCFLDEIPLGDSRRPIARSRRPAFTGIAGPLQQADNAPFGGGGEHGKVFGHRFAAAQAGDPFGKLAVGGWLHANADVGLLLLVVAFGHRMRDGSRRCRAKGRQQ